MCKRLLFFICVFLWSAGELSAQMAIYDIASYARPDLERRTAQVAGILNIQQRNEKDSKSTFSTLLVGRWRQTRFVNTQNDQIQMGVGADLRLSYDKDNPFRNTRNIWSFNPILQLDYSRKFFYVPRRFLEVAVDVHTSFEGTRWLDSSIGDHFGEREVDVYVELAGYKGQGRLERVNDAWHAVTILDFLNKKQQLTRAVSADDIQAFAEKVSEILNFRNTDFRLERIAEFEALCAYLVENDLIDPQDYATFAVLLDAWQYESFIQRLSGSEFKYGLKTTMDAYHEKEIRNAQSLYGTSINPEVLAVLAYHWYLPLSEDWQLDLENELGVGPEWRYDGSMNHSRAINIVGETNWALHYLPSQRTNYSIILDTYYRFQDGLKDNAVGNNRLFLANLEGSFSYYINPQLGWSLVARFALNRSASETDTRFLNQNSVIASINYRLW